ncbi:hypothetical protein F4814DRAFT_209375 [Daldinia grandis]|nr:hypothetical protein F4814DRAFT_209375 [Daldinia grandis]
MASRSSVTVQDVRLYFLYDFEKKEFVLRFPNQSHATAYQAMNHEARIHNGRNNDVWLPSAQGMTCLRSCYEGIAVIFESKGAAEEWRKRTIIGNMHVFEGDGPGVYFKRSWSLVELEKNIGLGVIRPGSTGLIRQVKSEGNSPLTNHHRKFNVGPTTVSPNMPIPH